METANDKGAFDRNSVLEIKENNGQPEIEYSGKVEWTKKGFIIAVRVRKKKGGILRDAGIVALGLVAAILIVGFANGDWGLVTTLKELITEIAKLLK